MSNCTLPLPDQSSQHRINVTDDLYITGWVDQPNTRGTIDIIWTCVVTIFLCTWTVLCLNVPARSDSTRTVYWRRLRWMVSAIAGPEFVLGFAAGQYENALQAVAAFKNLDHVGQPQWTMRHAFFAEMGGFMLHPRDSTPFPVNNKHLLWLISKKFMDIPRVESGDIWDKSKANTLIKSLVCAQICWLILNVLARAIQKLAVTTIELATVSIVFCTVATYFCWLHKPADVLTPIDLHIDKTTAEILAEAGDVAYRMTPLDFVDNLGPSVSANVVAFVGVRMGPQERPLPRFTNDRFPHVRKIRQVLLVSITLFSDGIHLFGWNFSFPTRAERILWRVASMQMFWTAAIFWAVEILAGLHRDQTMELLYTMVVHPSRVKEFKTLRRNRPPRPQQTPETFPLPWEFGFSSTMWVLYLVARIYVLVEMFVGLRRLPRSAYTCVQWSSFLPHV